MVYLRLTKHLMILGIMILLFTSLLGGCAKDEAQPLDDKKAPVKIEQNDNSDNNLKPETVDKSSLNDEKESTPKKSNTQKEQITKEDNKTQEKNNDKNTETKAKSQQTQDNTTQPKKKEQASVNSTTNTANSTKQEQKSEKEVKKSVASITLTITGYKGRSIIPTTKVEIQGSETVFGITQTVLQMKHISYSKTGSGATLYVQGIQNDYEFDHGPNSGWLVKKNGNEITGSAGTETVKKGDTVSWIYTTDFKVNGG